HGPVATAWSVRRGRGGGDRVLTQKPDLYSLGVVFYELLTGKKPFTAENVMEMFMAHVQGSFAPPSRLVVDVPPRLNTLVCQLLAKDKDKRPFDADTVSNVLARVQEDLEALKSEGAAAARSRAIDRAPDGRPVTDEDRDAAQALLGAKKKKRKKRAAKVPFYRQIWFQAAGMAGLLLALAAVLYVLLRPPSAETLYKRIDRLMASEDPADWKRAFDGPIQEYQRRYGTRDDERTRKVEAWESRVGVLKAEEELEDVKRKAKKIDVEKMDDLSGLQKVALRASQAEDDGDLGEALRLWGEVAAGKQEKRDDRYVVEVARRRDEQFRQALALLTRLDGQLKRAADL